MDTKIDSTHAYMLALMSRSSSLAHKLLMPMLMLMLMLASLVRTGLKRSGELTAFKWSLPFPPVADHIICSQEFEKREWKVFCTLRGDQLHYGIEYFQGVECIHMAY